MNNLKTNDWNEPRIEKSQFKLLQRNDNNVIFPSTSAEIFKKSIKNSEIIMINKRNDSNLTIVPIEELINDEIRNCIISPVKGRF